MLFTRRTSSALVTMIILMHNNSVVLLQMVQLIKDPKGETVMDHSTTKDKSSYHVGSQAISDAIMQDEVAQLKQRVSELEKELEEVIKHLMVPDLTLNAHSSLCLIVPGWKKSSQKLTEEK